MTIVTVTDVGKYGVVQDHAPHTLPPEAWSSGSNWRFENQAAHRIKGEQAVLGTPSVDPLFIMPWFDGSTYYWIYASGAAIYYTDGSTHTDISRLVGGAYNGGSYPGWTGMIFGGVPVMNNTSGSDIPQSWDGTGNMEALPNWPASTYCKVIRGFKQYIIMLNMTESGTHFLTKIRWSVEADPGTLPTSYVAAATNNAGGYSLSETTGEVLDGLALGDVFMVYKEDSTHIMRLVGGTFVFHTTQAFRTLGILSTDCVVEFDKKHLVVTQGDVVVHDGTEVQSIIEGVDRKYLFDTIDSTYKDQVRVVYNQQLAEIMIMYPVAGSDGLLAEAAVWHKVSQVWSFRELSNVSCASPGTLTDTVGFSYIISALTMTIDEMDWPIGQSSSQSNAKIALVMGVSGTGKKFIQVDVTDEFDGVAFDAFLERTGLAIAGRGRNGSVTVDPTSFKYLREFYPRVTAPEGTDIMFRFGSQEHFDEDIFWDDWQTFTVGTDRKLDVDMSYVFFALQVKAADKFVEFDGYDLDMEIIGRF